MKYSRVLLPIFGTTCCLLSFLFPQVHCAVKKAAQALNAGCPGEGPLIANQSSPNGDTPTEPLENMIFNAGYAAEKHTATTKDGYILGMYRVCKRSKKSKAAKCTKTGTPVLLVHGLLGSADNWVLNDKNKALAYKLVEDGKDVWLGSNRGTTYSQRHESLSTKQPQFWDYTHVELGLYDIPAFLDKIEAVTKQKEVFYIGHSLGTKQFFTWLSLFPKNCSRIKAMWALAPVAYLTHQKSVPVQLLATAVAPLGALAGTTVQIPFLPDNQMAKTAIAGFCAIRVGCPVCENLLFTLMGYNPKQVNQPWIPAQLGHFPDVTSLKTLMHNGQEIIFDRFGQVDLGPVANPIKYGKKYVVVPPQFDPSVIGKNKQCNIHLYYSDNDLLAATKDVEKLNKKLGKAVKSFYKIPDKLFSHLDFLIGKDVHTLVYDKLLKEMKQYK